MHILVIGNEQNWDECRLKFGDKHIYSTESELFSPELLERSDVVFDFVEQAAQSRLIFYHRHKLRCPLFLNASKTSLKNLTSVLDSNFDGTLIGFAGLPTFLNRELLEVSLLRSEDEPALRSICAQLHTSLELVGDKAGLVTPRVVCMIINEAYFTCEEGTASREDIDLAMKLGTSYPWGPFEWSLKIGVRNVYEVLRSVYQDTNDERYRISPLLKKEGF